MYRLIILQPLSVGIRRITIRCLLSGIHRTLYSRLICRFCCEIIAVSVNPVPADYHMSFVCCAASIVEEKPLVIRVFVPAGMHTTLGSLCCRIKVIPEAVNLLPSRYHLSIFRIQIIPSTAGFDPAGIGFLFRTVELPGSVLVFPASRYGCSCIARKSGLCRHGRRKHHKSCLFLQCLFHIVLLYHSTQFRWYFYLTHVFVSFG